MANATDYLTQHAAERPHALAISTGRLLIHYGVLEQGVWRAAALLRNAGVAVGDVVGVALPDTPMYLIAVLALGRIGAVQTPLPMSDPAPLRQSYARRFGMKYVIAAAETGGVPGVRVIRMDRAALDSMQGRVSPGHRVDADDRVLAIWRTSGTTSEAKGVAITHRQWLAAEASRAQYYPRPLEDRFLNVLDMSLSFGLNMCQRALYNGGAVFLPPKPLGVKVMLDLVDSLAINRLAVTPNMLDALLPALPADQCRCPGIRDISVAGMIMPESLRREVRRRFSPGLIIRYGSNEARYVTHADAHTQEAYPETVGPAMHGVDLEIVDENDRPVARGEMGRVRARAPWMATGYYNAPELDAGTFRGGWVYLGDVGVLSAEGMLYIKGRVDDMMNCDGIKIMPADIEEVLLRHPAVAEAAAFPLRSQRHQDVPAAAVVLRQAVTVEALQDYCRKELGARAPTLVGVVKAMPRNAMGKVVRRTLAEQFVGKLQKKA